MKKIAILFLLLTLTSLTGRGKYLVGTCSLFPFFVTIYMRE